MEYCKTFFFDLVSQSFFDFLEMIICGLKDNLHIIHVPINIINCYSEAVKNCSRCKTSDLGPTVPGIIHM